MDFGDYIKNKRNEKGISLRDMAERLELAPSYLSDIEKGRRYAPDKDKILKMAEILCINSEDELDHLFDLAGKSKDSVAPDLPELIKENEQVRTLLRTVKRQNISDEKLGEIIEILKKRD